jgi:beta-lactamase class A
MKSPLRSICVVASILAAPAAGLGQATLETRIRPLIEAHKGDVAVMVKHLQTGEAFAYREHEPQATASLIKFPVMIEAYRQSVEEGLDLKQPITLQESDKVQGSGILTTHFSAGATFALKDAIRLMIAFSDNTATNLVLDKIGLPATAAAMEKLECPNTKIHAKVFRRETSIFPERSQQFGLGSTTAAEMIRLCELLHQEQLVSPEASREMLAHLKKCEDKLKFPRLLPAGAVVAFKTGSVNEVRTAAGILYTKGGPVALCVLTAKNADQRWTADNAGDLLCAQVAREVYDHFPARSSQE